MEIAPGIRRIGSPKVNVYLIDDPAGVTVVDAGLPGYWDDLVAELGAMGRTLDDLRAVILTHAHDDHIGMAERARTERGLPIRVHTDDAGRARGEAVPKNQGGGSMRPWPVITFLAFGIRRGYIGTKHIGAVETFDDGATLDVPGAPRVIHVPGHTAGSVAFHLPDRSTLLVGDALITLNVINGATGPQLFPNFTLDNAQALASLGRFDGIDAEHVLPGHGEAWTGGVPEAVRLARGSDPFS
jgi:glyoxylase-like metal-dependent hydrolase (beta-lactamase superfamily II)